MFEKNLRNSAKKEKKKKVIPASEFLNKIYQAYRHYLNADQEVLRMVNLTLRGGAKKCVKIRWCIWNKSFSFGRYCL